MTNLIGTWVLLVILSGSSTDINGFRNVEDCSSAYRDIMNELPSHVSPITPYDLHYAFCVNTENGSVVNLHKGR